MDGENEAAAGVVLVAAVFRSGAVLVADEGSWE
jgi:hypothetical protein